MKWKDKYNQYRRILYLLAVIVLLAIGGVVAYLGNSAGNPLLITIGVAGLAGGVMLFQAWRSTGTIRIESGQIKDANSLVISENAIAFANVDDSPGQAQKCHNDGRFYHILKAEAEKLVEFCLPDDDESERYYDPSEFANPVTMPSNKKYFTWSISTMQKISVGIMALIIGGLVIGLVALGG